mmetsp:Transcript_1041/g.1859  ORF Transcript_1041/g.1859 Transcript_1041/m.1859 type:complete len:84 (+) Transcript_1041:2340-2591(+)
MMVFNVTIWLDGWMDRWMDGWDGMDQWFLCNLKTSTCCIELSELCAKRCVTSYIIISEFAHLKCRQKCLETIGTICIYGYLLM